MMIKLCTRNYGWESGNENWLSSFFFFETFLKMWYGRIQPNSWTCSWIYSLWGVWGNKDNFLISLLNAGKFGCCSGNLPERNLKLPEKWGAVSQSPPTSPSRMPLSVFPSLCPSVVSLLQQTARTAHIYVISILIMKSIECLKATCEVTWVMVMRT